MSAATTDITKKKSDFSLGRLLLEGRAFFALIAIIVVFSILSPNYLTVSNLLIMASHVAIYGILAIGMLLVILNGGIDLSVGSILALAGVSAGAMMQGLQIDAMGVILYPPVWAVVVLTCVLGALVGAVNGILISIFKVPSPWHASHTSSLVKLPLAASVSHTTMMGFALATAQHSSRWQLVLSR